MKKKRLPLRECIEIEQALSSLPHPLRVEREGRGPVKVVDEEGNFIQLVSYNQLQTFLLFIQKNCPHQ
jgi:hypothetical protein